METITLLKKRDEFQSFIQQINVLSSSYMPCTLLGSGDTSVNNTFKKGTDSLTMQESHGTQGCNRVLRRDRNEGLRSFQEFDSFSEHISFIMLTLISLDPWLACWMEYGHPTSPEFSSSIHVASSSWTRVSRSQSRYSGRRICIHRARGQWKIPWGRLPRGARVA